MYHTGAKFIVFAVNYWDLNANATRNNTPQTHFLAQQLVIKDTNIQANIYLKNRPQDVCLLGEWGDLWRIGRNGCWCKTSPPCCTGFLSAAVSPPPAAALYNFAKHRTSQRSSFTQGKLKIKPYLVCLKFSRLFYERHCLLAAGSATKSPSHIHPSSLCALYNT